VFVWLPGLLAAQTQAASDEPDLRGELVRYPDASVDVSVLARDLDAVPQSLWSRIAAGGAVSFLGQGSTHGNESTHQHLEGLRGLDVADVADASSLPPVGVQVQDGDVIRLVWYHLTETEGVAILADARAGYQPFPLRILIPDPTATAHDWWGLQAALSKAGIRRVQIISGRP
jgi:hypothetical protein